MSYVSNLINMKEKLKKDVEKALTVSQVEEARSDPHARRPPRPCGITIHPGTGCVFRCTYCYVYDMGFSEEVRPYPLSGLQLVYALLSNRYFVPGKRGTYLAIGSITEPFHPTLREKTLEYIEAIYSYLENPTQFSTKLYIDLKTAERLARVSAGRISPLVTVVTMRACNELEPGVPKPEKRFETIKNLREAGLKPFLFLRPIIPGITEKEYAEIIELAAEYGAVGVVAGSLRVTRLILGRLKEAGINVNAIANRLKVPVEKMRPKVQYEVYVSDIKREIGRYARRRGLTFYPSACMANLHANGLKCWKMCTELSPVECGLEEPDLEEVQQIARSLGITCKKISFGDGTITVETLRRGGDSKLLSEVLRSRYLACVRVVSR